MENLEIWNKLSHTDPKHTKKFKRSGGFEGTAIKPMFSYLRMTEEFGPCGIGWGINEPNFQVVAAGEETLVYCTVSIWHGTKENTVYGVGGDKVAGKNKYGLNTDDEAFKKAFTDGITNALKLIGVGADVHMGMFDDNKYVNAMAAHFSDTKKPETKPEGKFTPADRSLQNTLITKISQAKDKIDMQSVIDEISGDIEKLPTEMAEQIQQEIENRLECFEKGITPYPLTKHKYAGVNDAIQWMIKMKPVVEGFKSAALLLSWQTENQAFINGLDCLDAKKYADPATGKLPKERFTDALKAKYDELTNIELSQQQIAAE